MPLQRAKPAANQRGTVPVTHSHILSFAAAQHKRLVLRYIKELECNASELLRQIQSVYTPLGMPGLVMAAGMDTGGGVPPQLLADISRLQGDMGCLHGLRALEQQLTDLSANCGSFMDRCASELQQECVPVLPKTCHVHLTNRHVGFQARK
jgi:hypothetical protein